VGSVIALGSWFVLVVAALVEWQGHTLARIFLSCRWVLVFVVVCDAGWFALALRWHPRYAFVLHASPLCGAAPTFLCRRKEK
jgi:hypothetical protein